MDVLYDSLVQIDGVVNLLLGRREDVVVSLHSKSVNRNACGLHPLEEFEDTLCLSGLCIVVVVVEQEGVGVCLVGILECLVDEFLTGNLEHRRLTHGRLAGTYRTVCNRLVNYVPGVNYVLVTVYYSLDVALHPLVEFLLGKEVSFLVLIDPRSNLGMPHKAMAAELDTVLTAEVCDLVGILPGVLTSPGLGHDRLHVVLSGDAVELLLKQRYLLRSGDIPLIDCNANHEIVLVGVLEAGRILRSLGSLLCGCCKSTCEKRRCNCCISK